MSSIKARHQALGLATERSIQILPSFPSSSTLGGSGIGEGPEPSAPFEWGVDGVEVEAG